MKSNPPQDPLQRDIREWSYTIEKGQGDSKPKSKDKGKGKGMRKHQGKGNHNQDQDQAGSPNEDRQRTLGDSGIKRQRVEFDGDVQENDDFEDSQIGSSFAFKSARVLWGIRRNCQVRRRRVFD